MPDSLRRAFRTLFQVGTVNVFIALFFAFGVIHWNAAQVAAVNAVAIPLVTFLQNALEDSGTIPSVLKSHASSGKRPVTQDPAR